MLFLGTGAAELLPCPFCRCEICSHLRATGEKKRRSAFLIDEENIVDFGGDIMASAQDYGLDFSKLRNIFITHSHDDHFSISNFMVLSMSRNLPEQPICVYLSKEAFDWALQVLPYHAPEAAVTLTADGRMKIGALYVLCPVHAGESFAAGGLQVLALPTCHKAFGQNETALNYCFTLPGGRSLLYACDTGMYSHHALTLLKDRHLDDVVMECTFGSHTLPEGSGHMDAHHFIRQLQLLAENGCIDSHTAIYATHLNHKQTFTPAMLQAYFRQNSPLPVFVARDGMEI